MARVHYLKRSHSEAVLKCYDNAASPDPIDISLADLVASGETFDANNAFVSVKEVFWVLKRISKLTSLVKILTQQTHTGIIFLLVLDRMITMDL